MYKGLDAAGRVHKVVNHKRMFVNSEGDHTNAVEGFWSVLKKHLKLWFGNQSSDNSKVAKRFHLAAFVANSRFAGFDEAPALLMLLRFWNDVRRVGPLLAKDILESATAAFSFPSEKELEDFAPDEDPAPTVARAAPTNTASPELVGTLTENVVVVEEEAAEGRGDPEDAEAGEDAAEAGEDAAADDDDDDDEEAEEEEEDGEDDEEADGEEDDEVDHEADEYGEAVDDDYEAADGNYDDEQADASDDDMELVPRPQKKQHRAEGRGVTWREPISDVGPQGPNRERLMTSTPRTPPRTRSGRLGPASQYVRASVVPPHLLPTQDVSTAAA